MSIVSSQTISGDTFYRNKPFDISFGVSPPMDVSMVLITSPLSLGSNIVSGNRIVSSGFSNLGLQGTLYVGAYSNATLLASNAYTLIANSRIDTSWTSVGGVLPLFKYEAFYNSFTAIEAGDTLAYDTGSTELLGYLSGTGTSNVLFRASNGATTAYSYPLTLMVRALSNTGSNLVVVDDVSTSVTLSPARLVYSPCNATLSLYRNEPVAPVTLSVLCNSAFVMYSSPTLPAGLSLTTRAASNAFFLSGTPTIQTASNLYTIIGQDTCGRIYTTQLTIGVGPERLVLDVSGSLSIADVQSNAAITPATITARFPPYGSPRSMAYTWSPALPVGIQFLRKNGSNATSPASINSAEDASFGLTLSGTITEGQLRAFALDGRTSYTVTLTGARTSPLPTLSPSLPKQITFRFKEVLFFDSSVSQLLVGLPVTSFSYSAKTYFPAIVDTSITSIAVTDGYLPDGLAGSFNFASQLFTITGTPTNALPYFFTLTASNAASTTASLPVSVTVSNDSVTIAAYKKVDGVDIPLVDPCFNFIQNRSLTNAKEGYYPYPIFYSGTASSGCNVTFTGSNFPAGILITSNGTLIGSPSTPTGSTIATVRGTAAFTGVTADISFRCSVSAEVFTFDPSSATYSFQQNVPIQTSRITATTFSENPILRYSAPSLPPSVQLDNVGVLSGTPIGDGSGTFDVTAFTSYSSATKTYPYTTISDVVVLDPAVYTTITAPGETVSIPITGYTRSGTTVSNYQFQSPFPYGLSINPTTGLLSGTLASSLPTSTTFTLQGSAGTTTGTLVGTMSTANLTVNRAQMIGIQGTSNMYIYSSDDNGTSWTLRLGQANRVGSRIGTNGSNVYIVPTTGSNILWSSNGSSYSNRTVSNSAGYDPIFTGVANKAGTSTWWIGGTLSNAGVRTVYVFKSTDDGATWDAGTAITTNSFRDRGSNLVPYPQSYNAYVNGGVSLAYKDGVLLLGGNQILRSTDDGATWTDISTGLVEVGDFSVDHESVWIAAGTSLYPSYLSNSYSSPAQTLLYSTDMGLTWSTATTEMNANAYQVKYGRGAWMATGLQRDGSLWVPRTAYSFDGITWTRNVDLSSAGFSDSLDVRPLGPLGPIGFDETDWKVMDASATRLWSHPYDTPLTTAWTSTDVSGSFSGLGGSGARYYSYTAQTIDPGADVTTISFPPLTAGPVFTSPAQSTYAVWQYMPVPTITFSATGTAPLSYVVSSLPVGLRWDPVLHTITGACMRTGLQSFIVYAIDGLGNTTAFRVTLTVEIPRIIKKQSSAGAYTALVRDYTEVAAAINARDTRVNPIEEAALGSFASPYAPDVVTPSNCPC